MSRTSRIVFVVGAGASCEFDLPAGDRLVQEISESARIKFDHVGRPIGTHPCLDAAVQYCSDKGIAPPTKLPQEIDSFSSALGLAFSIDNYLNAHSANAFRVAFGKANIYHHIRTAERHSKLFFEAKNIHDKFDFSKTRDTWLHRLFSSSSRAGELKAFIEKLKLMSFICFNYDRVIERFFFLALTHYFGLSDSDAAQLIADSLDVLHPYGAVGDLRYQLIDSGFGGEANYSEISRSLDNIKTFSEGGSHEVREKARQKIYDSGDIFFLGFSFLSLNLEYLASNQEKHFRRVIGTSFGVSADNARIAAASIREKIGRPPNSKGCEFFPCHTRNLIDDFSGYIFDEH